MTRVTPIVAGLRAASLFATVALAIVVAALMAMGCGGGGANPNTARDDASGAGDGGGGAGGGGMGGAGGALPNGPNPGDTGSPPSSIDAGGDSGGLPGAPNSGGAGGGGADGGAGVDATAASDTRIGQDSGTSPPDGGGVGPAAGQYGTAPPMLDPNSEMAVAAVDGKIYVLGGYPSSRQTQSTMQVYDTATRVWTRGAPLPITIHHPVTVGVNGKLYSLGGQRDMTARPDTSLSYVYDPAADAWSPLPDMPTARGGGAGSAIDDKIYVVGGRPPAANVFEVFDVSENAWTVLPDLPARANNRNHLAAAALGGKIYVAGGRYDGGSVDSPLTDALDVFDPATNVWTAKKPLLRPRGGVAGVAAFGCFFVFGGEGRAIGEPNNVFPDHDVYDPTTDTWTALPRLPIPFHGVTGGAFVGGVIYMPGGGTSSGGNSGSTMHQTYRPAVSCGQ